MGLFDWLFRHLACKAFDMVDANKNGTIEDLEVELAILHLYNKINKRLPGWQDPPTRDKIQAALKMYDRNGDGVLQREEFVEFARAMVCLGPDQFFKRLGKDALISTAALPVLTVAVRGVARATPLGLVPGVVLAPLLGTVCRAVRGLLPFGAGW